MSHDKKDPLAVQVGGDHYKKLKIQPFEYNHANEIPFAEGNIIKYVTRWRAKGGLQDLEKARHFLDLLIAAETPKTPAVQGPALIHDSLARCEVPTGYVPNRPPMGTLSKE